MAKTIFITGITGFLGRYLACKFLKKGYKIVALVRNHNDNAYLYQRVIDVLSKESDIDKIHLKNLTVILGDISDKWDIIKGKIGETAIDEVWHCAANLKYRENDKSEITNVNIVGTKNILEFTLNLNKENPCRFIHISTAYVCGNKNGRVYEEIDKGINFFHNLYEWSKYEAECMVDNYRQNYGLETIIFRPTIIIGDSITGKTANFSGYYGVCKILYHLSKSLNANRNLNLRILTNPEMRLNFVPINFVVEAMYLLSNKKLNSHFVFHIANENPPSFELIKRVVCEDLDICGIELVSPEDFDTLPMTNIEKAFHNQIEFQSRYLLMETDFDTTNLRKILSYEELPIPVVDENLLHKINRYCFNLLDAHRAPGSQGRL